MSKVRIPAVLAKKPALPSLQAKLVLAMTALMVLTVLATGAIFVLRSKGEREQQALDRLAATAPILYQRYGGPGNGNNFIFSTPAFGPVTGSMSIGTEPAPLPESQPAGETAAAPGGATAAAASLSNASVQPAGGPVATYVQAAPFPSAGAVITTGYVGPDLDKLALAKDVRILLVGDQNIVLHDTGGAGGSLQGQHIQPPGADPEAVRRGFYAWQSGTPAGDLTFVAPAGAMVPFTADIPDGGSNLPVPPPPGGAISSSPYGIVVAVPSRDIDNAWLSALPGVGLAGGVAVPIAVVAAMFIASHISRPIRQLTFASEALAQGDFDQRVEVLRNDEVGRLAKAFSTMAERVGERDVQMRSLVANVSHDLKTPMTSIMGYAQAMEDGLIEPERLPQVARVIREQAAQTNLLLADLLFLSEVDAGQALPAQQDIAAAQLAESAIERRQAAADQKSVTIELTADESVCAGVDAEKLTRALANVLDNAIRFSPEGGTITVDASNAGDEVQIEVTNTGPQITPEELSYVFERFFRGADDPSGHGLGLAIAHEAVELSGGRIEARNTPTGVAVTLTLPRRTA